MPICNPGDLADALPRATRLLGFDVGDKTIGLALSDTTLSIATPLDTLRRNKFAVDVALIKEITLKQGVGGVVLGLPVNMDGTSGPRVQSVRAFAHNLLKHLDLPLTFWDERLSTAAVTRTLLEADVSRARRAELVDKMAAAYILQGFLDHLKVIRGRIAP